MSCTRHIARLLLVATLLVHLGCEVFCGPIIVNRSTVPLTVVATFSGRVSEFQLQPGHRLLQRERHLNLEALRVTDGLQKWEFSSADIKRALAEAGDPEHAVVELLGAEIRGRRVTSRER